MTGFYNALIDCAIKACRAQSRQAVKGLTVKFLHAETTARINVGKNAFLLYF